MQKAKFKTNISIRTQIMLFVFTLISITVILSTIISVKIKSDVLTTSLLNSNKKFAQQIALITESAYLNNNWTIIEKILSDSTVCD